MTWIVIGILCIIATTLTEGHASQNPKIEVYEIRENQLNKKILVKPVKLQYDLESRETKTSDLDKLLLIRKNKKVDGVSSGFLKKLQDLKEREIRERVQKEPLILILAANNNLFTSSSGQSSDEFIDETRTQNLLRPKSDVVYHIVSPKREKKRPKGRKPNYVLRSHTIVAADRTMAPIHKHNFAYDEDK